MLLCSVQVVGDSGLQQWVVGTLDLNLGVRLPGEELIGFFPEVPLCDRNYTSELYLAVSGYMTGVDMLLVLTTFQYFWNVSYIFAIEYG